MAVGASSAVPLDWAAAEAAARGCPLRLVHIVSPSLVVDPYAVVLATTDGMVMAWTEGERLLAEAAARARSIAPGIEISTRLAHGSVARTLRTEAAAACLLVLGHRPRSRVRSLLTASVCAKLVGNAPCPVVVIRSRLADDQARSAPRVVVGIDTSTACVAAVGFAFQAARQRDVPLVAVHAQAPDDPRTAVPLGNAAAGAATRTWRTFECALGRWHGAYPDVVVHAALVRADPASALIAQSRGAALLVIGGARGPANGRGPAIGLVSRTVLGHGDAPFVIVRQDAPPPAFPRPGRELDRGNGRQAPRSS